MAKTVAVILAAGLGTRMDSDLPKVLELLDGKPLLGYVLDTVRSLEIERIVVVIGYGHERVKEYLGTEIDTVIQEQLRGTGHAVARTRKLLEGHCDDIMALYGDTPLLTASTLRHLRQKHEETRDACTLLTAVPEDTMAYGRIVRSPEGKIKCIVEEVAATPEQKKIREINVGAYCFKAENLFWALDRIKMNERKKEYFLTDCIGILGQAGLPVDGIPTEDHDEFMGVNTPEQLARAEEIIKRRKI